MNLSGTTGESYGMRLHRYLEQEWDAAGTTRAAWCRKVGLSDSTVLRWDQGIDPDLRNLRVVAEGLGLTLTQLLIICGYIEEGETKASAPPARERPTVADAIELDRTISNQERTALRAMHEAFQVAQDGHKRVTRIRSSPRR